MSFTLTLNSSNVVGANNNTYQYQFISGGFHAKDMELAVGALTMPYAWYNVTQAYNNNTIFPPNLACNDFVINPPLSGVRFATITVRKNVKENSSLRL